MSKESPPRNGTTVWASIGREDPFDSDNPPVPFMKSSNKNYKQKAKRRNARHRDWSKKVKSLSCNENKKYFLFDDKTQKYVQVTDCFRRAYKNFGLVEKEFAFAWNMRVWDTFLVECKSRGAFRPIRAN